MYGQGISKVGEILDLAVEMEIVKKSGSWFSYGTSRLAQGRDAVKDLILDNPELMAELEGKIRAKIAEDQDALLDPIGGTEDEGEIDD
jgi:recombination protein RecA